jgi:ABC-type bacteriocin/lantibiotic exporter with double-glycine peptidase domain
MNKLGSAQLKQDNDYSCGVWALRYLINHVVFPQIPYEELEARFGYYWPTEEKLRTTPEDGTSHESITNWLASVGVKFTVHEGEPVTSLTPFFLINYQWYKEGHYGVVVNVGDVVQVWNPGNGKIDKYPLEEFNRRWFSKRYGAKWALTIEGIR